MEVISEFVAELCRVGVWRVVDDRERSYWREILLWLLVVHKKGRNKFH